MNEEKEIKKSYSTQPYVVSTYGLEPEIKLTIKEIPNKRLELPYYSLCFARKTFKEDHETGTFESYWRKDEGKAWEDSLAYKLINDDKVKIGKHTGMVHNWETNESFYATDYYLIYYDMDHYMNKPSIYEEISNAVNVSSTVTLEFIFGFDEYILPIYKVYDTRGIFALSFADMIKDALNDLESCSEEEDTFFYECSNVRINEDEIVIYVCSENADNAELTFMNDSNGWFDIKRALCSVRIVDIKKNIS